MDFQDRLARLKESIETITSGLGQIQAGLTSVRRELDTLRQGEGLSEEKREQTLTQINWVLIARLGDLEELAASVARAADDLRVCLQALERGDVDAAERRPADLVAVKERLEALQSDLDDLRSASDLRDESREQKVDALYRRLEGVEARLRQLSEGQETLELQTALLSKEAEQDQGPSPMPALAPPGTADAAPSPKQLQTLQRRLATLIEQAEGLAARDAASAGRGDLPKQLAALQAARAADQRIIEQIRARSEALEAAATESARRAEDLEDRIQALTGDSERLDQAFSRLRDDVITPQGALASVTDDQLAAQQTLANDVAGLKTAGGNLNDRVARLEERRQTLQEKVDDLSVRQARQDNETRDLQKRLGRRSVLGMIILLVAVVGLGLVLLSRPVPLEPAKQTVRSEIAPDSEDQPTTAELHDDIAQLRAEMTRLSDSLALVARSVDDIIASPAPELTRRLEGLTGVVETLRAANAQQAQAQAETQTVQSQLQAELAVITAQIEGLGDLRAETSAVVAMSQLPEQVDGLTAAVARLTRDSLKLQQENSRLQDGQAQLRSELARIAAEIKTLLEGDPRPPIKAVSAPSPAASPGPGRSPSPAARPAPPPLSVPTESPPAVPTPSPTSANGLSEKWGQARAQGRYTLQLVGVHERRHMAWFLGQHRIAGDNAVHYGERGGRQWLVLFHGIYRTLGQALAAAGSLPADLAAQKPWARRIPTAGRLEPL
ncbi:MAG: hypothetical protein PVJ03_12320 [Chromatiaceae bacterium]|jgi:septal ring-binding cell division protein DamX